MKNFIVWPEELGTKRLSNQRDDADIAKSAIIVWLLLLVKSVAIFNSSLQFVIISIIGNYMLQRNKKMLGRIVKL